MLGRELRAAQLPGERGEGDEEPHRFLPVRQMEQQQEWRDPSRRARLGGIKLRLSLAWMTGRVGGTKSCRKSCIAQRTPKTGSGPGAEPGEARGSVGGLWDLHGQT